MKFRQCIITAAIILMTIVFCAHSQEEVPTVDNTVFDNPQRSAALFDHDDHNEKAQLEEDCSICHHVYEGKNRVEDESSEDSMCSECHALKETSENAIPLRTAFHKRCKECHFKSDKGPVLCGECHIRK